MKDHINVFAFGNFGNIILIGESNKPTDTISLSLDQGKTFLNYRINGSLIILDRIFNIDSNRIIAKKFANFHFYNNEINKMHLSKKTEMLNSVLDFLSSEKDKILKETLDGFLSKKPVQKGSSETSLLKAEIENRIKNITEKFLNSNSN